ncbi:plexin-B-like [Melanaphis sacchari]|uniref:Plexin A3 n=1 Tax=Melanaphis sacchari TaxID=742174 RepID=A0A2H8TK14_9HEMI|nr:plexin-B-like [Melanaphis sacchari]
MADRKKLNENKNYLNQHYMNNLLIYIMILIFPLSSSTLETKLNKIDCSDSMTCSKCAIKPMCVWSLEQQTCENENQFNSSSLKASRIDECPKFSVTKEFKYNNLQIVFNLIVKLSNDSIGFSNYLNNNCTFYVGQKKCKKINIIKSNNEIIISSCPFHLNRTYFTDVHSSSYTYFTFIKFNDVMLRFDNVADHYITFYKQEVCSTDEKHKISCATCAWNNDGYSNYLRWCSFNNTCKIQKEQYLKNYEFNTKTAYVKNDCAEINVTAVDPLTAPKTGGTIVTIIIRNHRIFAENRNITVTVAGTVCSNPRTSGPETITCTTSQSNETSYGPIVVEYSSLTGGVLKIESSQIFQFYVSSTCGTPSPILDGDQQLGGVESGGTSVWIRGDHFVEPCVVSSALLYVDLSNGVRQYAKSYCDTPTNDTYMVCRSPSVNGIGNASVVGQLLNFGLDITFKKNDSSMNDSLLVDVRNPLLKYHVHPDPYLVDFEIDGNSSVVVHGLHLQYVQPEDIVIRSVDSPSARCEIVSATRHSLICQLTMAIAASQEISVTFGNSLLYTVIRKASPRAPVYPYKLPSWLSGIIAISTGLIFVFVLVYCLKTNHRYNVTKNIRNPPVAFTGSQNLYKNTAM